MAGEIEARERLAAALAALEKLNLDLKECRQHLLALAYSSEEHEKAKAMLASAEAELEMARKAVSERQVQMGILLAARETINPGSPAERGTGEEGCPGRPPAGGGGGDPRVWSTASWTRC